MFMMLRAVRPCIAERLAAKVCEAHKDSVGHTYSATRTPLLGRLWGRVQCTETHRWLLCHQRFAGCFAVKCLAQQTHPGCKSVGEW